MSDNISWETPPDLDVLMHCLEDGPDETICYLELGHDGGHERRSLDAPPVEAVALGSPFHNGCRFCGADHTNGACNTSNADV